MTAGPIRTASSGDEEQVIGAIVLSFATDPPARWMFPDPRSYLRNFPLFARAFGGRALAHQSAYYLDNFAGVALWLPPGVEPDGEALGALLGRELPGPQQQQVFGVLEQLAGYHPTEPHWYLPMTGVDPSKQRNGYGSTLLRHALARVDEAHLPAYLESTHPANIPLYERHGFELLGTVRVGDAPPMFPMLRKAR